MSNNGTIEAATKSLVAIIGVGIMAGLSKCHKDTINSSTGPEINGVAVELVQEDFNRMTLPKLSSSFTFETKGYVFNFVNQDQPAVFIFSKDSNKGQKFAKIVRGRFDEGSSTFVAPAIKELRTTYPALFDRSLRPNPNAALESN